MTVYVATNCVLAHWRDPDRPRRTATGLLVCGGCRRRLERHLVELPDMYDQLVERHTAAGGASEIRAGGHAGLTLSDAVADARANLRTMLVSWCRAVADERAWTLPADTVLDMAAYLYGRRGAVLDWCLGRPWTDDFAAGIDAVHHDAFRELYPRGDRRVPVTPCKLPLWSDVATRAVHTCAGALIVTFRGDAEGWPDAVCDECGREVPPVQWRRLADRDVRLTVPELADLWRVPVVTVYRWATTDEWVTDGGRPARYSVADAERTLRRLRPDGSVPEDVPA